jgi:hypothetical protein
MFLGGLLSVDAVARPRGGKSTMRTGHFAFLAAAILGAWTVPAWAGTADVRDAPGGKRLLFIDGDDIRPEPGGKRLLFIDGDTLRDAPGGKRLLFIDGDDIRPEPGGIRLAFLDGKEIRRAPGGKVLLAVDGDDIRDKLGGQRLLFIDGKATKAQIVAALFVLKPEIFKLSAEEEEALKKAAAEAAAESEKAFADALFGKFQVINSNVGDWGGGSATSTRGKDGFVYLDLQFKGAKMAGIGAVMKYEGSSSLWLAAAPEGAVALAIYEVDGGKLTGKWIPVNAAKDGKATLGVENLEGGPNLEGTFKITEGKGPNGGAAYTGTVTFKKVAPADAHQVFFGERTYAVTWNVGGAAITGTAFSLTVSDGEKKKTYVVAAAGKGDFVLGAMLKESATSVKDFELVSSKNQAGYVNLNKLD